MEKIETYTACMIYFSEKCLELIGIVPMADDELVLKAYMDFRKSIEGYKRLDYSVNWHKNMIQTRINIRVNTLKETIEEIYGSCKEYIEQTQDDVVHKTFSVGFATIKKVSNKNKQ